MEKPSDIGRSKSRVLKVNRKTPASKLNAKILHGLQKALLTNPEANLANLLEPNYSKTLESFKSIPNPIPVPRNYDLRSKLNPMGPADIVDTLSPDLREELGNYSTLSNAIVRLLASGEVLFEAPSVTVVRVRTIVAKITTDEKVTTEHGSLLYLEERLPSFPAPKAYGVVKMGIYYLLFSAYVPGITLEMAWPRLDIRGKRAIQDQLDDILSLLRSLPFPEGTPLGGVRGEGCKDIRRTLRVNPEPIMNIQQFEDFVFTSSKTASHLYTRFLQGIVPEGSQCVFTHGDFRPANIIVWMEEGSNLCEVKGIIDWEASGFYPSYWESVKATNNLTHHEKFDWYEYLPISISPRTHVVPWLVDRLLDSTMENS